MTRYMLDTNTVSYLLKRHPSVTKKVLSIPMHALCISAITEGELRFGLARRPDATRLHRAVSELLLRMDVLPWDQSVCVRYGEMRAELQQAARPLAPLDALIAAQALHIGAVLVTSDRAFRHVAELQIEDWAL